MSFKEEYQTNIVIKLFFARQCFFTIFSYSLLAAEISTFSTFSSVVLTS